MNFRHFVTVCTVLAVMAFGLGLTFAQPTDDDIARAEVIADANAINQPTPPTIRRDNRRPISTAPEYILPRTLDAIEGANDSFVADWQSHDASVDTYLLAEAVRHRQATERIAASLEQLVAQGVTVNVTVEGGGGAAAPDMTGVADSISDVAESLRQAFGVEAPPTE